MQEPPCGENSPAIRGKHTTKMKPKTRNILLGVAAATALAAAGVYATRRTQSLLTASKNILVRVTGMGRPDIIGGVFGSVRVRIDVQFQNPSNENFDIDIFLCRLLSNNGTELARTGSAGYQFTLKPRQSFTQRFEFDIPLSTVVSNINDITNFISQGTIETQFTANGFSITEKTSMNA